MKLIRPCYHFLGSVYFAILLISAVAIFVVAGTVLESATESHRYAALFIYETPIFSLLLWGFFVNILFAATRRWPFKTRHVPFLIVHLGLLMVLGGVLMKHYFGVQGTMSVIEGSGSHEIFDSNSYALSIEKRGDATPRRYPLERSWTGAFKNPIAKLDDGLTVRLLELTPHSSEHLATWVKGSIAAINGLTPMPLVTLDENTEAIAATGRVRFEQGEAPAWNLYALRVANLADTVTKLYLQNSNLIITERTSGKIIGHSSLEKISAAPLIVDNGSVIKAQISLPFSPVHACEEPSLNIEIDGKETVTIPLDGNNALQNINVLTPHLGHHALAFDIVTDPLLAILEDGGGDVYLVSFNPHGQVWSKAFLKGAIDTLISYDDGYAGYAVKTDLPFKSQMANREQREKALSSHLVNQLSQAEAQGAELSPPLQLFKEACLKNHVDFAETFVSFLNQWDAAHGWLFPKETPLSSHLNSIVNDIDWKKASQKDRQGSSWSVALFDKLEPSLQQGTPPLEVLENAGWPLLAALKREYFERYGDQDDPEALLTLLTQQVFAAAEQQANPEINHQLSDNTDSRATLLSAYLRAYGIHLFSLIDFPPGDKFPKIWEEYLLNLETAVQDDKVMQDFELESFPIGGDHSQSVKAPPIGSDSGSKDCVTLSPSTAVSRLTEGQEENVDLAHISLETSVSARHSPLPPGKKLEENFPAIILHVSKEKVAQRLSLGYDRMGMGLKWPALYGEYLVRFQPMYVEIPYHLRLRQARQINYANSAQAYSYECDLIVTDQRTGSKVEKTISMNHVHETWDGYRFYLSSIAPQGESSVKRVQIVVNRDPAKYWLTYPGAIILSCGILMMFILRPYRKPKSKG